MHNNKFIQNQFWIICYWKMLLSKNGIKNRSRPGNLSDHHHLNSSPNGDLHSHWYVDTTILSMCLEKTYVPVEISIILSFPLSVWSTFFQLSHPFFYLCCRQYMSNLPFALIFAESNIGAFVKINRAFEVPWHSRTVFQIWWTHFSANSEL